MLAVLTLIPAMVLFTIARGLAHDLVQLYVKRSANPDLQVLPVSKWWREALALERFFVVVGLCDLALLALFLVYLAIWHPGEFGLALELTLIFGGIGLFALYLMGHYSE